MVRGDSLANPFASGHFSSPLHSIDHVLLRSLRVVRANTRRSLVVQGVTKAPQLACLTELVIFSHFFPFIIHFVKLPYGHSMMHCGHTARL